MEPQLREFIKGWYNKKPECQSDVNFFIAHVWKRDLKDKKLDYEKLVTKDFLGEMINKGLTNVNDIIKIWSELRSGLEIKLNSIDERNPRKKTSVENNVAYREYDMTDSHGNKIYSKGATIYLKLRNETRKLGVIDPKQKVFAIKRERARHLMRKINSYGFNHHFFSVPTLAFDKILLEDDYGKFLIPVKYLLEHCEKLNFAQRGFELQVFLRLERVETFKQGDAISVAGAEEEIVA